MNRRACLTALPAVLVTGVSQAAAVAEEDPILPHYRQWVAARKEWYRLTDLPGNGCWDMPESIAAAELESSAFEAMIEMTPISMAGVAAFAHVLWDLVGPTMTPDQEEFLEQADRPEAKLMQAIWRASSGHHGLPPDGRMAAQPSQTSA